MYFHFYPPPLYCVNDIIYKKEGGGRYCSAQCLSQCIFKTSPVLEFSEEEKCCSRLVPERLGLTNLIL